MLRRTRPYARRPMRRQNARTYLRRTRQPAIGLQAYNPARADMDKFRTILSAKATLNVDSSGNVRQQVRFSDLSTSTNWTALQGIFDQFKVDAVEIIYCPGSPNATTINFPPIYTAFDQDGAVSVPSPQDLLVYGSVQTHRSDQMWKVLYTVLPETASRIAWYDSATPTSQPQTVLISSENGFTGPGSWGIVTVRWYVKFRGSR